MRLRTMVVVSVFAGCVVACDEVVDSDPSHVPVQTFSSMGGERVDSDAMYGILTRTASAFAKALSDPSVRAVVFSALSESPYRENKLHFATLLRNETSLLARIATEDGDWTGDGILAALDSVVDLEFYMPVKAHKQRWRGDSDVLVATWLGDEKHDPIGFDLTGEMFVIDRDEAPKTPTLVIVPRETNFDRSRNLPEAAPQTLSSSGGAPGVYMTTIHVVDDHEAWMEGDPEFEIHTYERLETDSLLHLECAGEDREDPYFYDDNAEETWFGEVLLVSEATLNGAEWEMYVVEDDHSGCGETLDDRPFFTAVTVGEVISATVNFIADILTIGQVEVIQAREPGDIGGMDRQTGALNPDDLVGLLELNGPGNGCWQASGPSGFWIRNGSGGSDGDAQIEVRFGDQNDPICALEAEIAGPTSVQVVNGVGFPTPHYVSQVSGGSGTITYQWKDNGVVKSTSSTYTMSPISVGGHWIELKVTRGSETDTPTLSVEVTEGGGCPPMGC